MAGRPGRRARTNPAHVSLKDIGRDTALIEGVTYAEMGAVVILGRDNPGLFPFASSQFYLLKSSAPFKLQSGRVVEGQVLEMHPKEGIGIILPAGAVSNPRINPRDLRVTIQNLKRLAAPNSGATDNERATALRMLADLEKKLAEAKPAGRATSARRPSNVGSSSFEEFQRRQRARRDEKPDPTWYVKWAAQSSEWDRKVPKSWRTKTDYRGRDFRGQDLSDFDFRSTDFSGANLAGADLRGQDLRGADFTDADLRGADLRGAHLMNTLFQRTSLSGAKLNLDDLRGVKIVDPDFSGDGKMLTASARRLM